ncbi:hypothetical protein BS47DRAFT_1369831 [Hydnum rufescens UP504]|uniref:Uncharacterized protein n=1 Tax=Hydnum rufescens UP504 TaxID=1448309 RepID=A0A9P6DEI4_9AGAM|nr:hypothetical protein BS47DRAFT_1369831 [Hydnum rufescens UP504]
MAWAAPEGVSPSNFDGSSRDGRQRGPDVQVHQRPPAPISSGLAASHFYSSHSHNSAATFPSPAANAVAVDTWLEDINAFGVRAWKKAKHAGDPGNLSLLFKSYFEGLTLTDPEAASAAHVSNLDLGYINQAYAYKSQFFPEILSFAPPAYRKATAAHHFFDSERFPPVLATPSERCPRLFDSARRRPMNMVSFSLDWAEMQGAIHPILSSNLHYHRLLTLMRAQVYRRGKKDIRVNIWPTDGPYDEILRILARLAHDVYGSSVTQPLLDETFGLLQLSARSIALYIPPQRGFRVTRKTTTTLFSVPFHLEWRVSERKFLVSPLALTPRRVLQVVIFISGSSLLQYGWKHTPRPRHAAVATPMSSSNGSNGGNDLDSVPASKRSLRRASTTKLSTTSNSATKEKPLQTTSQPSGSHATSPHPSRTSSTRLVVEIPSRKVLTAPYTLNKISNKPTRMSSPFGYLSASSSACTPVADFDSNDEDFGTPFEHELEDGQASVTQGDDGLDATGDSFLDSINASSVPAYHGPKSCDTDVRNQREVSPPGLLDIQSPPYYNHVIPNHGNTPIHSPHPDSPDTPILDITDGTHDDFLLSDGDSDNAVPLKVRGNAKPHSKAVVSPQPVSHLSEEPSSDEDDEDLKGGPFTTRSYPTNPDKSVSQSDYTKNTVRPAYDELVKKYGGEKSEDWAAESAHLVKEYTETRVAISADIAKHGGEVAKIIASHKRAWQKDFRALASFGVHCELTVLADNACSPAAHAQNGQLFGTAEMESYYKSRCDFKSHIGDIYTFILSAKAGVRKAEEHKAQTLRHEQEEAFKNPNKAKGKVSKMLIQLFELFICWTTFPWLKLPQKLLSHNLVINGVLPLSHFQLFGSLSIDHYSVSEIQAMYNALENGQLKVSECTHEESNSGETALITDSGGQVLMTVASALEMIGAKKKLDLKRAAERAVVRAQAVDTMIDGGDSGGDSDGHHGNGRPVRNPSHTVMVNSDRIVTQGLGKRPQKGGDDFNQPRKTKHLQVKSAEIIDDLDETPTAGPSHLHVQATSSHRNDVQQHSAFSSDSEATVGIPLQHTTGVPIVPTFNPHDPFSMMDDVPIPNRDMSFPLLDPSLFQGPSLKHL